MSSGQWRNDNELHTLPTFFQASLHVEGSPTDTFVNLHVSQHWSSTSDIQSYHLNLNDTLNQILTGYIPNISILCRLGVKELCLSMGKTSDATGALGHSITFISQEFG